jgi:type IX secretion system PorP/SprF family membrane protein
MRWLLTFINLSLGATFLFAQDSHLTQNHNARTYLNPAFAGTDSTLVIALNSRLQWPKTSNPYQTIFFAADRYFSKLHSGMGLNYLLDYSNNGALKTSRVDFNYSFHLGLFNNKLNIRPAVQLSYFKKTADFSKLTFGDQIDPRRGFSYNTNEVSGNMQKSNADISAGILVYSKLFFGGVALHHINQPDQGFFSYSSLPMKLTLHGRANISIPGSEMFVISPYALYCSQQDFRLLQVGVNAKVKFITIGVGYRNEDALIGSLAFQNSKIRIGYSYDYTVSLLENKNTGGSHEIGISYFLKINKKLCSIQTLRLI